MSESYTVLARKYRPRSFGELVAQDAVSTTLTNALKNDKVHHAYLFTGPRGVGKTTSARILAKALNCASSPGDDPCGECSACTEIAEGRYSDVLEIDGASNNGIQQVRELRENAAYVPKESQYKIYIIDEVHMLTTSAFNGLLKTLEEPPPHVVFILATTEPQKVPATVQSRCQRFDFKRITPEDIGERIRSIAENEGVSVDDKTIYLLGKLADGSMRDAQSLLDQLVAFCGESIDGSQAATVLGVVPDEIYLQVTSLIGRRAPEEVFPLVEALYADGYDPVLFLRGLVDHLRTLLAIGLGASPPELGRMPSALRSSHEEMGRSMPVGDLVRAVQVVAEAERNIRLAPNPRVDLELALIRLALLASTVDIQQLVGQGGPPAAAPKPPLSRSSSQPSSPKPPPAPPPQAAAEPAAPPSQGRQSSPSPPPPSPEAPKPKSQASGSVAVASPPVDTDNAPTKPVTQEQVDAAWPTVIESLGAEGPLLAACIRDGKAVVQAGTVELQVGASWSVGRLENPRNLERLVSLFRLHTNVHLELRVVAEAESTSGKRIQGPVPQAHDLDELKNIATDEPLVRDVLKQFKVSG